MGEPSCSKNDVDSFMFFTYLPRPNEARFDINRVTTASRSQDYGFTE